MPREAPPLGRGRGTRLGKYQVLAHIATGGMGAVYKARDVDLGRDVALKILPHDLAARPDLVERFRREARHVARLNHENIVTLFEFGQTQDTFYLAMEFIDGIDLATHIINQGKLDPDEAIRILTQATRALEHSHEQGIVHRDVKPSNFLIIRKGDRLTVKMTDLGIAREIEADELRVTGADKTVGTIDYMSPEQARDSRAADIRSDIYSLGCTLYHMLAGRPPFVGTTTELVFKHLEEAPVEIRTINPRVSAGLSFILGKMLAKNPADRYQTPSELLGDLERIDKLGQPKPPEPVAKTPLEIQRRRIRVDQAKKTPEDQIRDDRDTATFPGPSPRQHRVAIGQFERANEALDKGSYDYGLRLLLSCCKLDPANLVYRQTLRRATKAQEQQHSPLSRISSLLGWLLKARLKTAKRARQYVKVLELGEQVLVHQRHDFGAQMDMVEAARELKLVNTAVWMLEQLHRHHPKDGLVCRELAQLYEKRRDFKEAIALWESIQKADPSDTEAHQKTKDLAASETIARGGYEDALEWPQVH